MSRSIKTIITNKEKQRKKELFKSVEDIKKFMLLLSHQCHSVNIFLIKTVYHIPQNNESAV